MLTFKKCSVKTLPFFDPLLDHSSDLHAHNYRYFIDMHLYEAIFCLGMRAVNQTVCLGMGAKNKMIC